MACSSTNLGITNFVRILIIASIYCLMPTAHTASTECASENLTFEIVTGYVFTAPEDTLELVPGTLHLTECLSYCRHNLTCQSVNFETGLCVLFSSSAKERPSALSSSQFPVFTIYAHKVCFKNVKPCEREWSFEAVAGYELLDRALKKGKAQTAEQCMELCLAEKEFECRSANFHHSNGDCLLSDVDRHSVPPHKYFVATEENTEYLESNCVDQEVRLCEFSKLGGKILKTVDAVFQDTKTLEGCRKKCLSVPFRCHAFDLGDPTNSVCRLSHLASPALVHIEEPYLEIHGASTYEVASCYNVTIECRSREMVAFLRTSKMFNGKVYVKSRPNSCVTDVINSLDFEIRMAYHDLNCDVKQLGSGEFTNDIVIQHHDMIVTNQDVGVTVHCQYDLANKSVAHGVRLDVNNDVNTYRTHAVSVGSPNVTMSVTDRLGRDLRTAQVGDALSLRFEITDNNSPYEIFVRELVAMDGIDNSEILLIDALGCPTDPLVMGAVTKSGDQGKVLQAVFDAFKFPTSEIVQFKALVTPCLPTCVPAECSVRTYEGSSHRMESLGRKRRTAHDGPEVVDGEGKWTKKAAADQEEELVVVQTIHITDKFGFDSREGRREDRDNFDSFDSSMDAGSVTMPTCLNMTGLFVSCSLFLVAQLVVLLAYAFVWRKRNRSRDKLRTENSRSIDLIYNHRRENNCAETYGIDNPYRSDITPYDTVYNLPQTLPRHY